MFANQWQVTRISSEVLIEKDSLSSPEIWIIKVFQNLIYISSSNKDIDIGKKNNKQLFKAYVLSFYLPKSWFRILISYLEL
jgi:hypothetical protein